MFLSGPWFTPSQQAIIRKIWHQFQESKTHDKDKRWFDFLKERIAFEEVGGFLEFHGAKDRDEFVKLAVEAMNAQNEQREARLKKTPKNPGTGQKLQKPKTDVRVGYHFKWSPHNSWQSLYWAASAEGKKHLIGEMKKSMMGVLKRFKNAPFLITCHTDTARVHFEVLILKYLGKKKLKGFGGTSGSNSDQWHRAALTAMQSKPQPEDANEWPAYISYQLTKELKEKTKEWFHGQPAGKQDDIIGKASVAYELLGTLETDETRANREKTRVRLGELAPPDFPDASPEKRLKLLAKHEFCHWLGDDIPEGAPPPSDYLAPVVRRAKRVSERRQEKENDRAFQPAFGTRRANRYARMARHKGKRLRPLTAREKEALLRKNSSQGSSEGRSVAEIHLVDFYDVHTQLRTEVRSKTTILYSDVDLYHRWLPTLDTSEFAASPGPDGFKRVMGALAQKFNQGRDEISLRLSNDRSRDDLDPRKPSEPEL